MEAAKADGSRRYLLDEQQVEMYKDRFVSIGMSCILVCVCVRARAREREGERERENISDEKERNCGCAFAWCVRVYFEREEHIFALD